MHVYAHARILQTNKTIINTTKGITMGSKPKVVQQESAEEIERKAAALAQKEANEATAAKRKTKTSTALASVSDTAPTALSIAQKTNTGT